MRSVRYLLLFGVLVTAVLLATPAAAQVDDPIVSGSETPETLPPEVDVEEEAEVGGEVVERAQPVEVGGAVEAGGEAEALPVTGGDAFALVVLGVAGLGLGAFLVTRARSRSRPQSA